MNIIEPEALFQHLDGTRQRVAIALQKQAVLLDQWGAQQMKRENPHGATTCAKDADAIRLKLEEMLLSAWCPDVAHPARGAHPC